MSPFYRLFCKTETWKSKKPPVLISLWASPSPGIIFSVSVIVLLLRNTPNKEETLLPLMHQRATWLAPCHAKNIDNFILPMSLKKPTPREIWGHRRIEHPSKVCLNPCPPWCQSEKKKPNENTLKCLNSFNTRLQRVTHTRWRPNY